MRINTALILCAGYGKRLNPVTLKTPKPLLKIKDKKDNKKLNMLTLNDSKPGEPLLLHDEPIYSGKNIIGRTTSGNFSFNFNKNLAFGYINSEYSKKDIVKENLFIEVEKKKYPASIILKPLNNKNIRSI